MTHRPRAPNSCPAGFGGRHTVVSGDTMFGIAQSLGITLNALIRANPHISNPNEIYPGDVLCVPGPTPPPPPPPHGPTLPCCFVLQGLLGAPPGVVGAAMLYRDAHNMPAFSVVARLPNPCEWGDFDLYVVGLTLGEEVQATQLLQTPDGTWAASENVPASLLVNQARIEIRPVNSEFGAIAEPVLFGNLSLCH